MEKIEQFFTSSTHIAANDFGDALRTARPHPDLISAFMFAKLTGAEVWRGVASIDAVNVNSAHVEYVCEYRPNTWLNGVPPHDANTSYADLLVCIDTGQELEIEFANFAQGMWDMLNVVAWMYLRKPVFTDDGDVS